jgi:hypothetical protein
MADFRFPSFCVVDKQPTLASPYMVATRDRALPHDFHLICISSITSLLRRIASDFPQVTVDIQEAPQECPEMEHS